ncbi:uncharacterized protein LOC141718840 [Apium graveolens]|uniref:uncharacterized protein LOC141718840 n=1 Tax=Apium graveolens TaxID=4045 RepID=UPI003D79BB1F
MALEALKNYLSTAMLLSKPISGEILYVYLSVTDHAVSGVLVREENGSQLPVYYISRSLLDAETRYTSLEKLTNYPLKNVLSKPELTGQMAKWSIRLSTYDISYDSRTTIKSQALADFVADFSPNLLCQADQEVQHLISTIKVEPWSLYMDGASNINGTGLGLVLKSPHGDTFGIRGIDNWDDNSSGLEYSTLEGQLRLFTHYESCKGNL